VAEAVDLVDRRTEPGGTGDEIVCEHGVPVSPRRHDILPVGVW
jgi:citrate lyase alpha subunit